MNVYGKLQKARVILQGVKMTKSGNNKFAGYSYFELGDFMPHINQIFNEVGLCGVVSFSSQTAELLIHETDGDGSIIILSPMADAQLKGCHAIQQLGAVETYQRRYLWMAALEIVEHDAIDSAPKITDAEKQAALQDEISHWCQRLESAENLPTLGRLWNALPKRLQPGCMAAKDARKAQFEVSA